ncbi:hypothetical protein PENTCL1PPCAC_413, partial [Pristionchus entomophagus]
SLSFLFLLVIHVIHSESYFTRIPIIRREKLATTTELFINKTGPQIISGTPVNDEELHSIVKRETPLERCKKQCTFNVGSYRDACYMSCLRQYCNYND